MWRPPSSAGGPGGTVGSGDQRARGFGRIEKLEPRRLMSADAAAATELVYSLNRIRCEPAAFGAAAPAEWSTLAPAPPLAFNALLHTAAESHSSAMASENFFGHRDTATGSSPNGRVRDAGYPLPAHLPDDANHVELIAGGHELSDPQTVLADLLNDGADPGRSRRRALLGLDAAFADYTEAGAAWARDPVSDLGNYWTILLASEQAGDRFLTGVVFDDADADGRYDAGEGIGGAIVTSGTLTTTTDSTGAYRLAVGDGIHRVRVDDDRLPQSAEQLVRVDGRNVQVDFPVDDTPRVNFRARSLWTEPVRHLDANQSGTIEPLDALVIINRLNRDGAGSLAAVPAESPTVLVDTNGDGHVTPIDALLVINHLNRGK